VENSTACLREAFGFEIVATAGTYQVLDDAGIKATKVLKISDGRPNIEDNIRNNEIDIVINTSDNISSKDDAKIIRQRVISQNIPYFTTIAAARTTIMAIRELQKSSIIKVKAIQDYLS